MIIFLSDDAYSFLCKKSSTRKLHLLIEWLSNQRFKDTRSEEFKELDSIRKDLNLPIIWYMIMSVRRKRNIKITDDVLARLAAIAIIFKITRPLDSPVNHYLSPLQLAGYTLEAIGNQSLTPINDFPTFTFTGHSKLSPYKELKW